MKYLTFFPLKKYIFSLLLASTVVMTIVSSSQAENFLLFYGNDVRGELEPCG
jgi:hypothetical protein